MALSTAHLHGCRSNLGWDHDSAHGPGGLPGCPIPSTVSLGGPTQCRDHAVPGVPIHVVGGEAEEAITQSQQVISEKISGIKDMKLDEHFLDMERKIDLTNKAVTEILLKATEYVQPNPAYRAKLGMLSKLSKICN